MTDFESYTENYRAALDRITERYKSGFSQGLDEIIQAANIRLDILQGKPVGVFRRIVAESVFPTEDSPKVEYGKNFTHFFTLPDTLLGGDVTSYFTPSGKIGAIERAERKASEVRGAFFEIHRPPWNYTPKGKDLIYVYDIDKAEMPNPTVHFVSVDPESKVYGRPTDMYATDVGFRPCPYGNHSYAYRRPEMGKVELTSFPTDIHDLAANASVVDEGIGMEFLARAVAFGSALAEAGLLDELTRFYGANMTVYSTSA